MPRRKLVTRLFLSLNSEPDFRYRVSMLSGKMCQEKKKNERINSHISRQVFARASETEINRERGSKEVVQVHHKARLSRGALQGFRCGALAEKINDRTNRKSSARKKVACPRQIANACVGNLRRSSRRLLTEIVFRGRELCF